MSDSFRHTVSRDGVPIPVPRVCVVGEVEVVDDEWIKYFVVGLEELQDEFYLRVLQHYDSDSTLREIADLMSTYGQLCLDDFAEWSGDSRMGNWEQRTIAFEEREEYKKKHGESLLVPETLIHEWEAKPHLDTLRFLRDGWIVASATGELSDYNRVWEGLEYSQTAERTVRDWLVGLNAGLRVAHPRIEHPLAYEEGATLYGASCLQLYNHIMEQVQYKICANESCGQFFVRQQGRTGSLQRKTEGVKYCSSKCAKAQAQRELRRRRAQDVALDEVIFQPPGKTQDASITAPDRERLCETLRQRRLEQQLDDRQVRRRAGVAAPILVAIEAGDFSRYEGQLVHMERWIRGLARLYELDENEIVARYRAEVSEQVQR